MKTMFLIIGITILLVVGFAYLLHFQYTHYKTLGNNEMWYYHPDGYKVECEIRLFQTPSQCKAIDENGIIVDTKTELGDWNGVKWLQDPDYCKAQGGIWNDTTSGCYGLYHMCENDGGVPRFLKKSLPFPDVEENKPIEYFMDCYYGIYPEDNYLDELEYEEKQTHGVTKEFEGIIIDQQLGKEFHEYHFYTNELSKINTGSLGIRLDGIDHMDDLDGKYVKLFGSIFKKGEEIIAVDDVQILYSVTPTGIPRDGLLYASINEIHANPDKYYNQTIIINGELREHDADVMVHSGVGCNNAKYTTNDEFVAEFISSQQLYDEDGKHLGVRIGNPDNIGISKLERLPIELKNNQVEITGIFVPILRDMNSCNTIIHKSGYILTDFSKITPLE